MNVTQLLRTVTPPRRTLALMVALLLLGSLATLANPLLAGKLTATLLGEPDGQAWPLRLILLAWLGLLAVQALLSFAAGYLVGVTGARMAARLRSRVHRHLLALPLAWFQAGRQGDTLALLANDVEAISNFVTVTLVQLAPQALTLVIAFGIMAWIDPLIALLALALLPAYAVVIRLLGRSLRPLTHAWMRSRAALLALVNENLGLVAALKAFVREPVETERFEERNRELLELSRQQVWHSALLTPAIGLLAGTGALALLWVAVLRLESGALQASELVMLVLYILLLNRPIAALAGVFGQVMRARGAAERLLDFFARAPEPAGSGRPLPRPLAGRIAFEDVSFAYPGRPAVLERFTLVIEAGEIVALTGPNGAGKSTVAHLLLRLIEPDSGRILLDGQDIRELDRDQLRRAIGLVSQTVQLQGASIAENIAYGCPQATEQDCRRAARMAQAEAFIDELPEGFATLIGEGGVKLSGGQRQRLSLARSLLLDPPVLVLDEATAMFDPAGEADFIAATMEGLAGRTLVLITHRPASLALADRIIEMRAPTGSDPA